MSVKASSMLCVRVIGALLVHEGERIFQRDLPFLLRIGARAARQRGTMRARAQVSAVNLLNPGVDPPLLESQNHIREARRALARSKR